MENERNTQTRQSQMSFLCEKQPNAASVSWQMEHESRWHVHMQDPFSYNMNAPSVHNKRNKLMCIRTTLSKVKYLLLNLNIMPIYILNCPYPKALQSIEYNEIFSFWKVYLRQNWESKISANSRGLPNEFRAWGPQSTLLSAFLANVTGLTLELCNNNGRAVA